MEHQFFRFFILKVPWTALAIASLAILTEVASIQFSIHAKESSISQLINGISKDLQELIKCFNGATVFIPFKIPLLFLLPTKCNLYLNDKEFTTVTFSLSAI